MATRVEEAYTERDQKVNAKGKVVEVEIPYIVFEADNEGAALSAARTKAAGESFEDMELDGVEVTERVNKDTWKVKAIWKSDSEEEDDDDDEEETSSFAFDTGGGTMHRNQSLKTVAKVPNDRLQGLVAVQSRWTTRGT